MLSKRPLVIVLILAAAVAAFLALRSKPVEVEAASVKRGPLAVSVDEEGKTRVRHRFVVAAPVSGRLERSLLDEGDTVEVGKVVARMHSQPLDPRLAAETAARLESAEAGRSEAQARVEQARAALAQASRSAVRARRLGLDATISKEELELSELEETTRKKEVSAAEHAADRAEFDVRAAQAALLAAGAGETGGGNTNESAVEITAPAAGSVLRIYEENERVVSFGTPLLEIGNPGDLEIVVDVLSKDAVGIHPGTKVSIEEWGGPNPVTARVRTVEPSGFKKTSALGVDEQRVNVIVDFDQTPPSLGDSYRVEARILVWESDDVLQIPTSALFRHQGEWTVFVIDGNHAHYRKVKIGHLSTNAAEVTEGLSADEQVVVHPSDLLSDGVRVAYEQR